MYNTDRPFGALNNVTGHSFIPELNSGLLQKMPLAFISCSTKGAYCDSPKFNLGYYDKLAK